MSDPYTRRTLPLTDADRAEWERWEKANRAAAEQYEALPIEHHRAGVGSPCVQCHRRATRHKDGVCPACRRGEW